MTIYHLNNKKSSIRWNGTKNGSAIKGHLKFEQGQFVYELGKLLEGRMVMDLRTAEVEDTGGGQQQKLAVRLQTDPRFDLAHYPLASYKFDEVYRGATDKELHGMLQLKDKVFHLTIPFELSEQGDSISASGDFNIQKINPELFDALVGEDNKDAIQSIDVHMEIVAESRESET